MGPIQLIPPGLLGYLQLKTGGQNPTTLADELRGVLDLTDWYFQARAVDWTTEFGNGTPASVAIGFGASIFNVFAPNAITVPDREAWWVEEFTITTGNLGAATERCQFQCMMYSPLAGTVNTYALGDPSPDITGAAVVRRNMARARHFFAPPGFSLGVGQFIQETAGNITYTGYVRLVRLPL